MLTFTPLHPRADDFLGLIPDFLDSADPRPAAAQIAENYAFSGGWKPMAVWELTPDNPVDYDETGPAIRYPGDPPLHAIAKARLREERIYVFPHAWVAIVQPDGTFEVSRMD